MDLSFASTEVGTEFAHTAGRFAVKIMDLMGL